MPLKAQDCSHAFFLSKENDKTRLYITLSTSTGGLLQTQTQQVQVEVIYSFIYGLQQKSIPRFNCSWSIYLKTEGMLQRSNIASKMHPLMGEDENTSHDMPTHQRLSYAVILAQRPFNSPYRSPLKSMVAFPHTHTHTHDASEILPPLFNQRTCSCPGEPARHQGK